MASKDVLILETQLRDTVGTRASRRARDEGLVPAVIYGHKQEPISVLLQLDELEAAMRHHTRMLDLNVSGKPERVLLTAVQYGTFGEEVIHADFLRIAMDEVISVDVPVVLHGHAIGEQHGGVTEHLLDTVTVECLPGDIPEEVRLVITDVEIGNSLHVSDLTAPEGTKITTDPELLVMTVASPTRMAEEEEEAEAAAEGAEEPELIGREEEEGEEGEESE